MKVIAKRITIGGATITATVAGMKAASATGTADGVCLSIEAPTDERIKQLEVVYNRHIQHVYTLCLRLLKEAGAAEDATVAVFVRFNREMKRHLDDVQIEKRLRQLSINEALSRRKARDESNK